MISHVEQLLMQPHVAQTRPNQIGSALPVWSRYALNRRVPSHRRPQGVDLFFQDTDPSSIAQLLHALEEHLTIRAMVFHDPFLDLLLVGIKLGRPRWTWFRDHRFWMLEIFAHRRTRDAQLNRNLLH